jgi:hypothetical protein
LDGVTYGLRPFFQAGSGDKSRERDGNKESRPMKKTMFAVALAALLCGGCVTNPLYKPSKGLLDTVIPEYEKYVENDPNLSALEKNVRIMNTKSYRKLIEEYEGQKK